MNPDSIFDYLIIGQGIAGSMLAYHALKRGCSVLVIDSHNPKSASNIATGVINPVTGRKLSRSWMIDTVLPYAKHTYREIEQEYGIEILHDQSVFRILSAENDVKDWNEKSKTAEYQNYLGEIKQLDNPALIQPYGTGEIKQACWVDVPKFIQKFRADLKREKHLREEEFLFDELQVANEITYRDIKAKQIIFCEGYKGKQNPYFKDVPLSHAKGEQLEFTAAGLNCTQILNKNIFILPLGNDSYLCASTFIWDDTQETVTENGRNEMLGKLDKMIRVPYKIISEKAGIRPTITDRRPVLGASKDHKNVFIFNGLGTKGISLAPYFSNHLLDHIELAQPLIAECDIQRFRKM